MRAKVSFLIVITALFCGNQLHAQSATGYLPAIHNAWTYETTSTLGDSLIAQTVRNDSLAAIIPANGRMAYTIISDDTLFYTLAVADDTLFMQLSGIIDESIIDETLFDLELDITQLIPIAIFGQEIDQPWDILDYQETFTLSDSLKSLVPENITVEDDADLDVQIRGYRTAGASVTTGAGEFDAEIFEVRVDLEMTLYANLPFFGRTAIPLELFDEFPITIAIAPDRGIVRQYNDEYDVYARNESLDLEEYLLTIAASTTEMQSFRTNEPTYVAGDRDGLPGRFTLSQNYPNPFNPVTTISYYIPERTYVSLAVYNILGSKIATLVGTEQAAGSYRVAFDASPHPSGVYFYRLQAGSLSETKRMVLSK
jgi:hypothetical protein